eukprot:3909652-Amphidinium_carterae.1
MPVYVLGTQQKHLLDIARLPAQIHTDLWLPQWNTFQHCHTRNLSPLAAGHPGDTTDVQCADQALED